MGYRNQKNSIRHMGDRNPGCYLALKVYTGCFFYEYTCLIVHISIGLTELFVGLSGFLCLLMCLQKIYILSLESIYFFAYTDLSKYANFNFVKFSDFYWLFINSYHYVFVHCGRTKQDESTCEPILERGWV